MPKNIDVGSRFTDITAAAATKTWQCPKGKMWFVDNINIFFSSGSDDKSFRSITIGIVTEQGAWKTKSYSEFPLPDNQGMILPVGNTMRGGEWLYVSIAACVPQTLTKPYFNIYPQIEEYDYYTEFISPVVSAQAKYPNAVSQILNTAKTSTAAYASFLGGALIHGAKSLVLTVTEQNVNSVMVKVIGLCAGGGAATDLIAEYDVLINTSVTKYLVDTSTVALMDSIYCQFIDKVGAAHGSIKAWLEIKF